MILKRFFLFKKIDNFLFIKIDELKKTPFFNKYLESLSRFTFESQNIINQITTYLIIFFPIIVTAIFYINVSKKSRELDLKQNILKEATHSLNMKQSIKTLKKTFFTTPPFQNRSDLNNRIKLASNKSRIDLKNISLKSFKSTIAIGNINSTKSDIEFKALSLKELVSLVSFLTKNKQIKINNIKIHKDDKSLLNGTFNIIKYDELKNGV
ncbi:hypothetical protein OAB57_01530 [Bacteriovoracaceae bacterium]|nr:hypothetical protein [Bacteriovoracaceae bacterium]